MGNFTNRTLITFGLIAICLISTTCFAGNLPLEVLQPIAGYNDKSRFHRAYPGLQYNVQVAVVGGTFPYFFELVDAPAGMTIRRQSGQLEWDVPANITGDFDVNVRITDVEGTVLTRAWQLKVTKSGFLFVDALNGRKSSNGGAGTYSNPWKTMQDVYGGTERFSTFNPNAIVYWKSGEYSLEGGFEDCGSGECRVAWYGGRKPMVWLAYPGDSPIINFNTAGSDAYLMFTSDTSHLYIEGFKFNINSNTRGKGLSIGNKGNITIRNNSFFGNTNCFNGGNNSVIFLSSGDGENTAILDNHAENICGYMLLGYDSPKTLVSGNFINSDAVLPIGPKTNIQEWTIRSNVIKGTTESGAIWNQEYEYSSNIEINHNLIMLDGENDVALKLLSSNPGGAIYVNRNTFIGNVVMQNPQDSKGPWVVEGNVIINNNNTLSGVEIQGGDANSTSIVIRNNLVGRLSDEIVDAEGVLTNAYIDQLGEMGHQLGTEPRGPLKVRAVDSLN